MSGALGSFNFLPTKLKNSLFHLSFNFARPEFESFPTCMPFAPNMEMGLTTLAQRGIKPKTVIDVGAFGGNWSARARRIWQAHRFEPNVAKLEIVSHIARSIDATLFQDLLGASDETEVIFNLMESGSSVMSERSPLARTQEKRMLRR